MLKSVVTACFLLFIVACATPPKPHEVDAEDEFAAPYDSVWTEIIAGLAEKNIPIKTIDKNSGIVVTEEMNTEGRKDLCDCGGGGITSEDKRSGSYNLFLKKVSETHCTVRVNASFYVVRSFDTVTKRIECVSTGLMERNILDHLRSRFPAQ